jgi:glucose-6-phosphate isomerase
LLGHSVFSFVRFFKEFAVSHAEIRFDFRHVLSEVVGEEHGVAPEELAAVAERLPEGHDALQKLRQGRQVAFYDLPTDTENIQAVKALVGQVTDRFDAAVVLGIGGSALGTIAVKTALAHPYSNELSAGQRDGMRLYVEDNVDPDHLRGLLDVIEPARTLFIVISKSGSTVETMSQFLLVKELLDGDLSRNVVAITDKKSGALRPIADAECLASLVVPDGVGGRFSVLSPVGLLPAALMGVDIDELLAGARDADRGRCSSPDLESNDAYMAAAVEYLFYGKGHRLSVMMPYSSALRDVADWYRQLWAESLGKNDQVGPTPVKALGVTDQHSQVQLYREGPNDKVFCFLGVEHFGHTVAIPPAYQGVDAIAYIGGHSFNELIEYERVATTLALTDAGRPNYTITLPEVSAYTLGQLFHMLEVKTAMSGQLYRVDAFNQPGVEAGKVLAYGLMGRKGYEPAKQWIEDKQAGRATQGLDAMIDSLKK